MTPDGKRKIFSIHALAIVNDPDQRLAAGGCRNLDPARTGIDGIFDKLFDNTCRPLDDFTGGDLVDQGFWQLMDAHDLMFRDSGSSAMCVSQLKREKGPSWRFCPSALFAFCGNLDGSAFVVKRGLTLRCHSHGTFKAAFDPSLDGC